MIEIWGIQLTVWIVLICGIFVGSIIKGITGFGSTIAHLCIWAICKSTGYPAGTMQQAVLAECVYRTVAAVPLMLLTRAHLTADRGLVAASLALFQCIGAPIGASLLAVLDQRVSELVLACILLVVAVIQLCDRSPGAHVTQSSNNRNATGQHVIVGGSLVTRGETNRGDMVEPLLQEDEVADEDPVACPIGEGRHHQCNLLEDASLKARETIGPSSIGISCSSCLIDHNSLSDSSPHHEAPLLIAPVSHPGEVSQLDSNADRLIITMQARSSLPAGELRPGRGVIDTSDIVHQQGDNLHNNSTTPRALATDDDSTDPPPRPPRNWSDGHTLTQRFLMGSFAGSLSGGMAGLTGVDGPPVILMFRLLGVPKEVARGTNAVINMLLMHWLLASFVFMGVLHRQDVPLFAAAGVVGLVGTFIGNRIAAGMNQGAFNQALFVLVLVCCVLMFASAFGLVE